MINDLIQTAAEAGNFKTLTAALRTADLISTLEGAGPYTVFAPTDAAFARLPKTTVDSLFADKEKLKGVLLVHVLAGKVNAHAVGQMQDGVVYIVLGGGAFLFTLLRLITVSNFTKYGLYIALVAGAFLAYGGWMKLQAKS